MNAANAVGDDTLQKRAQGYTVPDSFTYGTSAQRMRWFMKGIKLVISVRVIRLMQLRCKLT